MPAACYPRYLPDGAPRAGRRDEVVSGLLSVARHRLGMELAVLSRRVGDVLVVEHYDGDAGSFGLTVGTATSYERSSGVLEGRLPQVMRYAGSDERAPDPAFIRRAGIGSYVVAPILLPDGTVYGALSCFSHEADPALRERDASFLALLAGALANRVCDHDRDWRERDQIWRRISRLIDDGGPVMHFQPIYDRATLEITGVEALARYPGADLWTGPRAAGRAEADEPLTDGTGPLDERGPEQWFADAASVGLGVELEIAAIRNALAALPRLPPHLPLAVNASPTTIVSRQLLELLAGTPPERLIVEVTEHGRVDDYPALTLALDILRARGVRAALDDVGAGYAGLHQLLQLRPDIIKLDQSLTRRIEEDPTACRALAMALVRFAEDIGAIVLAEGVETRTELEVLSEAGVHQVQGFFLSRPGAAPVLAGPPPDWLVRSGAGHGVALRGAGPAAR